MPVVGFNFDSISAKRMFSEATKSNVTINSTPTIVSIDEKKGSPGVVSIRFTFKTSYEPKLGFIELGGELLYQAKDAKEAQELVKSWGKTKKVEKAVAVDVLNAIFRRSLVRVTDVADEIILPPPIRLPVVKAEEQSKYIG